MTMNQNSPEPWRAIHHLNYYTDEALEGLAKQLPKYREIGLNTIILEVNYHFDFQSDPKITEATHITKEGAAKFTEACRDHNIRLIPQVNCFGHQSWAETTFTLLTNYPQLDMTPGAFPKNKDIYCREWNPYHPDLYKIVLPLIDEVIDAFDAEYFHIGMDEVFLINHEKSVLKDHDPAAVFAKAINDLHDHITGKRGVTMMMWADRLLSSVGTGYHSWEADITGTYPALNMIPKDIILCDWHYEVKPSYPSVPLFVDKGFRVLPTGWNKVEATNAFIEYADQTKSDKMLGHCFSTWSGPRDYTVWPPIVEGLKKLKELQGTRS
jgi:hypothetical protein